MGKQSRSKKLRRIFQDLTNFMKDHFAFDNNVDPMEECETLFELAASFVQEKNPKLSEQNQEEASILIAKLLNDYFKEKAERLRIPDPQAYLARAWTLEDE